MPDRTEVIYTAGRIDETLLLQGLLAERGIESVIENEALQGAIGGLPAGEATAPRVRVAADDADKARQVVQMFERQERAAASRPSELLQGDEETWRDWPRCPQCDARRQTICPVCHVAGDEFALAEFNPPAPTLSSPSAGEVRPLLMCPTCDEAFTPQFYRRCAWCGHEFGDGLEPAPTTVGFEGFGPRAWLAVVGLAAAGAAIFGYFYWVTR